jgi:hypothetical protein
MNDNITPPDASIEDTARREADELLEQKAARLVFEHLRHLTERELIDAAEAAKQAYREEKRRRKPLSSSSPP